MARCRFSTGRDRVIDRFDRFSPRDLSCSVFARSNGRRWPFAAWWRNPGNEWIEDRSVRIPSRIRALCRLHASRYRQGVSCWLAPGSPRPRHEARPRACRPLCARPMPGVSRVQWFPASINHLPRVAHRQVSPPPCGADHSEDETIENRPFLRDLGIPSRFTSMPSWTTLFRLFLSSFFGCFRQEFSNLTYR